MQLVWAGALLFTLVCAYGPYRSCGCCNLEAWHGDQVPYEKGIRAIHCIWKVKETIQRLGNMLQK